MKYKKAVEICRMFMTDNELSKVTMGSGTTDLMVDVHGMTVMEAMRYIRVRPPRDPWIPRRSRDPRYALVRPRVQSGQSDPRLQKKSWGDMARSTGLTGIY